MLDNTAEMSNIVWAQIFDPSDAVDIELTDDREHVSNWIYATGWEDLFRLPSWTPIKISIWRVSSARCPDEIFVSLDFCLPETEVELPCCE